MVYSIFYYWALNFISATFFLLLFFGRLLVQRHRKEATQILVCVARGLIQDAVSALSLFCLSFYWDVCQMPNLSYHRAGCCEWLRPLSAHNFAGLSAVLPPCSLRPHQIRHRKHIAYIPKISVSSS